MKITFTTEDGAELILNSDTLKLANTTDGRNIALAYQLAGTLVPLVTFNGQISKPTVEDKPSPTQPPEETPS